jgi:hypothetical protein
MRPRQCVVKRRVILRLQTIGLRSSACECIEDDLRCGPNAAYRLVLLAKENSKIVDQLRRDGSVLRIRQRVFTIAKIACCFGQIVHRPLPGFSCADPARRESQDLN